MDGNDSGASASAPPPANTIPEGAGPPPSASAGAPTPSMLQANNLLGPVMTTSEFMNGFMTTPEIAALAAALVRGTYPSLINPLASTQVMANQVPLNGNPGSVNNFDWVLPNVSTSSREAFPPVNNPPSNQLMGNQVPLSGSSVNSNNAALAARVARIFYPNLMSSSASTQGMANQVPPCRNPGNRIDMTLPASFREAFPPVNNPPPNQLRANQVPLGGSLTSSDHAALARALARNANPTLMNPLTSTPVMANQALSYGNLGNRMDMTLAASSALGSALLFQPSCPDPPISSRTDQINVVHAPVNVHSGNPTESTVSGPSISTSASLPVLNASEEMVEPISPRRGQHPVFSDLSIARIPPSDRFHEQFSPYCSHCANQAASGNRLPPFPTDPASVPLPPTSRASSMPAQPFTTVPDLADRIAATTAPTHFNICSAPLPSAYTAQSTTAPSFVASTVSLAGSESASTSGPSIVAPSTETPPASTSPSGINHSFMASTVSLAGSELASTSGLSIVAPSTETPPASTSPSGVDASFVTSASDFGALTAPMTSETSFVLSPTTSSGSKSPSTSGSSSVFSSTEPPAWTSPLSSNTFFYASGAVPLPASTNPLNSEPLVVATPQMRPASTVLNCHKTASMSLEALRTAESAPPFSPLVVNTVELPINLPPQGSSAPNIVPKRGRGRPRKNVTPTTPKARVRQRAAPTVEETLVFHNIPRKAPHEKKLADVYINRAVDDERSGKKGRSSTPRLGGDSASSSSTNSSPAPMTQKKRSHDGSDSEEADLLLSSSHKASRVESASSSSSPFIKSARTENREGEDSEEELETTPRARKRQRALAKKKKDTPEPPKKQVREDTVETVAKPQQQQQPDLTQEDIKNKCGATKKFCFCAKWEGKRTLEWVVCEKCDQWFHVLCVRLNNIQYAEEEVFNCCGADITPDAKKCIEGEVFRTYKRMSREERKALKPPKASPE